MDERPIAPPLSPAGLPGGEVEPPAAAPTPLPPAPTGLGWGTMGAPTPVGAPPAPDRRPRWPVILAALVAVLAGVVVFLVLSGDGSRLPDELGGQPLVTDGPMAEMSAAFADMEFGGVSFDVGVYGGSLTPAYMVMVIEGDMAGADAETLLTSFSGGFASQTGASIDLSQAISEQIGDTEYLCAPTAGADGTGGLGLGGPMTMCVFQSPATAGVVMSFVGEDLPSLLAASRNLEGQLD